ncbi:MAG: CHASE4 domain-containing protein [Patescibacteria group bacterium]
MSIRLKTLVTILITTGLFFVFFLFTSLHFIPSSFDQVENTLVQRNVMRASDALDNKVDEISIKVSDWAQWDDSYNFIQNNNKSFVSSNLTDEAFTALKINLIVFIDTKGSIKLGKFVNLKTGKEEPLPESIKTYLKKSTLLTKHTSTDSVIQGVIDLPGEDMLIASRPIITSKGEGPIRGTIIFGRYFDKAVQESLIKVTHMSLTFTDAKNYEAVTDTPTVSVLNNKTISGSKVYNTIQGMPAFVMTATFDRDIHTQGVTTVLSFSIFFGILIVFFAGVILLLLDRIVLSRLTILNKEVKKIKASGNQDSTLRIVLSGKDELSVLASEINEMVDSLQKSAVLIQQSEEKVKEEAQQLEKKNETLEKSEQTLLKVMTDLEDTKDKIEQEKTQDETMLESIGEGLIVTDKNGIVLIINKSAQEMLKFTAQELQGKRLTDLVFMTDEKGSQISPQETIIEKVLNTGTKESHVYYFIRKDGTRFPSAITTTAIELDNAIIGAISVLRDITKEKEVDKMKTEFISLASHQLRAPLTAIKWFAESLLSGKESFLPAQRDYLQNIYDSNERMIDLVDSLLNISRIESGKMSVFPKLTDLGEMMNDLKKEFTPKIDQKKQTVNVIIDPESSKVLTDPKLIRHVYMNLFTNALKYSPVGSLISVHISKKEDAVVMELKDQGYGIPADQKIRLFEKFFRAENIRKVETEGTGLGLYLAKTILDVLGGKIWYESVENEGTTFWVSLPKAGVLPKDGEVSIS